MTLHHGDCIEVMATFEPESIDAIVTDPPYGLGFMGKAWDHGVPGVPFWVEMLRVAKPGAHLLAFGGTRTVHRIATAIEDAGWEIRDTLVWAYASGFPKSLDVSKAMDKAAGAEREVTGERTVTRDLSRNGRTGDEAISPIPVVGASIPVTAPATDLAREWQGWGTALKPAWEPILLARKPLRGTVAGNVTEYGTGALNIDGCRIASPPDDLAARREWAQRYGDKSGTVAYGGIGGTRPEPNAAGRWPANVILTDPIFDGDTPGVVGGGETTSVGAHPKYRGGGENWSGGWDGSERPQRDNLDSGTYSRFFLIPKAARRDREPAGSSGDRVNTHPTVKPTALMRHLVRLVTPPRGVVLDPFLGSGTTALAAEAEGFEWVGIEREAEYVAIAEARLDGTERGLGLVAV